MSQRYEIVVDGVVKREVPNENRANEVAEEYAGTGEVTVRPVE